MRGILNRMKQAGILFLCLITLILLAWFIDTSGTLTVSDGAAYERTVAYSPRPGFYRLCADTRAVAGVGNLLTFRKNRFLPYAFSAEGFEARIGETLYETLAEAVTAARDGDTITGRIPTAKALDLDLGGNNNGICDTDFLISIVLMIPPLESSQDYPTNSCIKTISFAFIWATKAW